MSAKMRWITPGCTTSMPFSSGSRLMSKVRPMNRRLSLRKLISMESRLPWHQRKSWAMPSIRRSTSITWAWLSSDRRIIRRPLERPRVLSIASRVNSWSRWTECLRSSSRRMQRLLRTYSFCSLLTSTSACVSWRLGWSRMRWASLSRLLGKPARRWTMRTSPFSTLWKYRIDTWARTTISHRNCSGRCSHARKWSSKTEWWARPRAKVPKLPHLELILCQAQTSSDSWLKRKVSCASTRTSSFSPLTKRPRWR